MLVLVGIELIFFAVAGMGLCLGFVLETVLVTQGCFCYRCTELAQTWGFSVPHPTSEWAGDLQEVGRGSSRDSWGYSAPEA